MGAFSLMISWSFSKGETQVVPTHGQIDAYLIQLPVWQSAVEERSSSMLVVRLPYQLGIPVKIVLVYSQSIMPRPRL